MSDLQQEVATGRARVRRTPEQARRVILEAATKVIAELGPDAASLQRVAKEAGVSHGLISHYFGTHDGLVHAVMRAYVGEFRQRLIARLERTELSSVARIADAFFEAVTEPMYARLAVWSMLASEDPVSEPAEVRPLVDLFESATRAGPAPRLTRSQIEILLISVWALGLGYGVARDRMWARIGRDRSPAHDAQVRAMLRTMVVGAVSSMLGKGAAAPASQEF